MQNNDTLQKKLRTNIKSALGTVALVEILTAIYIIVAFSRKDFDFFFSTYTTKFLLFSAFEPSSLVILSKPLAISLAVLFNAVYIVFLVLMQKNQSRLLPLTVLYTLDTAFLAVSTAMGLTAPFKYDHIIDLVFHLLVLVFMLIGVVSTKKLSAMGLKYIEEAT